MHKKLLYVSFLIVVLSSFLCMSRSYAFTGAYILPEGQEVFGFVRTHQVKSDREILTYMAIDYDIGYNELVEANPKVDPWYPQKDTKVLIPTSWVLPEYPKEVLKNSGKLILVNLAEMRLYYLRQEEDSKIYVLTFPIGIGSEGFDTPVGLYKIIQKKENPAWIVPESVKKEDPTLPAVVPPGPDNPLGRYALRLSNPNYLIHGTNKPLGIGRRVSHGCIRLYPEDIKVLYNLVPIGTPVYITYQPVKIGRRFNRYYIEVHRGYKKLNLLQEAIGLLKRKGLPFIDTATLYLKLMNSRGIPVTLYLPKSVPHNMHRRLLARPDSKSRNSLPQ